MAMIERIEILIGAQELRAFAEDGTAACYAISTARNGPGEMRDSECTPRGRHVIAEKIGAGSPPGTVFVARRATGEIHDAALAASHPGRDWILSRILWLAGLEDGVNRGGDRDTHSRYIYIHGTPDTTALGRPGSRGCIRMRNADIIELFERVAEGTPVNISE